MTRIRRQVQVDVSHDRGVFMISVAAELAQMHPQTLRGYEARGLIEPRRSPKGTRLYSRADVDRLRAIQALTAELGLSLAGVERVLALQDEAEALRGRIDQLERRLTQQQLDHEKELEAIRRAGRAELVPFTTGNALIRWVDERAERARWAGRPRGNAGQEGRPHAG